MPYEIVRDYTVRSCLEAVILNRIDQGWALLYALPQQAFGSVSETVLTVTQSGNSPMTVRIPSASSTDTAYEIVFIKKKWEGNACPRCDYPYNQDNIGRDG